MTQEMREDLVTRAQRGDRVAMRRLVDGHRSYVLSIALRSMPNGDDALDVVQEALVYATLNLPTLRDPRRFLGWLRQLTFSHCATYGRRRQTRRLGEPLSHLSEAIVESDYASRLSMQASFATLSDAHQTAMLLHYVGGYSVAEAAQLLDIPANTFRSRLGAAKRQLRAELQPLLPKPTPMLALSNLSKTQIALLERTYPGSTLRSAQENPEPWQPFSPRVTLELAEGETISVDFRGDLSPANRMLLEVLEQNGIPVPLLIAADPNGSTGICHLSQGENLSLWALGGTPHRIRLATNRAIEGLNRLQGVTEALLASPVGQALPRKTLQDELAILTENARWNADPWLAEEGKSRQEWLQDPWFQAALRKVEAAISEISTPLVYTDTAFFYPQNYRIAPATPSPEDRLGWPGDPILQENPLVEFTSPFGSLGDPLLGLAMVWIYDCYPFVHTGFVEQVLWDRGVSRREFAPRLALKALQMVARDLPVNRPEDGRYWDSIRGWAEQALVWM